MNKNIIEEISKELDIGVWQVEVVLKLLEEGNTVPFIARYRKEATGGLDEEKIRIISDAYNYGINLSKRKEDVIRLIEEKGLLTEELNLLKNTTRSQLNRFNQYLIENGKNKMDFDGFNKLLVKIDDIIEERSLPF